MKTTLLARTFFARFFESDLLPPGIPQAQFAIWALSVLAAPGLLLPARSAGKYMQIADNAATLAQELAVDRLLFITLTMIALGLVALLIWEGVFPDQRDARIIGVLPLRGSVLIVARLAALAALAGILLVGINALPTLMYGPLTSAYGAAASAVRGAVAHFVATACAGAFVFFTLVALQGVLLNVGSRRFAERLSVVLQLIFVVALLQMVFFFPHMRRLVGGDVGIAASDAVLRFVPSIWFLALYDVLGGRPAAGSGPAATLALAATAAAVTAAVGLMIATHSRLIRLALESQPIRARNAVGARLSHALATRLIRRPAERAMLQFTLRTLARSRTHRMLLAVYAGVALALILSGLLPLLLRRGLAGFADPSIPVLSIPFVVMFLTLVGVRAAFAIPVEPKANWVVRLMEPRDRVGAVDGVRDAMLLAVVLPATLAAFLSAAFLWGLWPGIVHGTVSLLLGWSFAEVLLLRLRKLPFTCTYFPGLSRLRLFWWAYLTAFTTYCYSTPILEQHIIERPEALATFSIVAIGGLAGLGWLRARELVELNGFKYHEEDPQAMFAGFQLSEGVAANRRLEPMDRTQGRLKTS